MQDLRVEPPHGSARERYARRQLVEQGRVERQRPAQQLECAGTKGFRCWPHGDDPRVRRLPRLVASPLRRLLYLGLNASPRWLVPMSFARRERLRPEVHWHYVAPFARRGSRRAPFVLGCELAGSDAYYATLWAERAALQRVLVTLIWGMADPAFGPPYLERLTSELPHARVVELPDVGHFPQEEAPEAVIGALRTAIA